MASILPNPDEQHSEPVDRNLKELNQLECSWRSILVGEDMLVAALLKSLRRNNIVIDDTKAAYEAVRDVCGELIHLARVRHQENLANDIHALLVKASDASGGGGQRNPETNP